MEIVKTIGYAVFGVIITAFAATFYQFGILGLVVACGIFVIVMSYIVDMCESIENTETEYYYEVEEGL